MNRIGYARVSSIGQSLDVQLEKLKDCDEVFKEKASGVDGNRPQLAECLRYLRKGDTLVITKLDRLARSTLHLVQIVDKLQKSNVELVVLDQNIDTSTSTGKLLLNMLASIAQFETEIRSERQADGIARAKEIGTKFGRKAKLTPQQIDEIKLLKEKGASVPELVKQFNVSKSSIHRAINCV
jgi:DNA invertase Pin-like site-specific DNA recombinase